MRESWSTALDGPLHGTTASGSGKQAWQYSKGGASLRGRVASPSATGGFTVADSPDRRLPMHSSGSVLKRSLNGAQLATLNTLERFGWSIKFVRQVPGSAPKVVLHDPDTHKYAVLDADGVLDENPVWERFRS